MKLHIGVDSQTGLAHRFMVTPANTEDKQPMPDLLHGRERGVYKGSSAYTRQKKLIQRKVPKSREFCEPGNTQRWKGQ